MNVQSIPDIDFLIKFNAPVAIGVSGGKDSQAAALSTFEYLDKCNHKGERILIHSDLGVVEWHESLPVCKRLAEHLKCELVIVSRKSGDLMDRWESRWESSVRRYINLETVTLVLPWSTPSMRFCTSELKTHLIEAELKKRFKGQTYINVTGVRRDESAARSKGSIASKSSNGLGWNWRPISDWTITDVFDRIAMSGLEPHKAYTDFGMSRVSCRFCIMSNWNDLVAAATQDESRDLYKRMVQLEVNSTFGFQGNRWLADVAPQYFDDDMIKAIHESKERGKIRVGLEKLITKGMLYEKGWPTRMLTDTEAETLANVRTQISSLFGFESKYLTAREIHNRYAELIEERERKESEKALKTAKKLKMQNHND